MKVGAAAFEISLPFPGFLIVTTLAQPFLPPSCPYSMTYPFSTKG